MASRRKSLLSVAALAVLGVSGYYLYGVFAAQGQGVLAQAPLNIQAGVKPAFIMAVDDSGSMTFETMLPGQDGAACWNNGSFFSSGSTLNTGGTCGYNHLIPYTGYRIDANRHAIPPIDAFGFARSPEMNPSYFDPDETYVPWLKGDGTPYKATTGNPEGNSPVTGAWSNPRSGTAPVIDLTSMRGEQDTALRFRFLNGMVIPGGTEYHSPNNCGSFGDTDDGWDDYSSDRTVTATCNFGIRYFPATFYLKTGTVAPSGFRTTVVASGSTGGRSLARNACGSGCDMYRYEIRPANYTSTAAYNSAIQNFANWFSYYGNRNRAMVAGMTLSLRDVQNMRIGYFTINNRTATVAMQDMGTPAQKTALYNSVLQLPASGGTPNLFAVDHIGKQFQRTDAGAPIQLACQKNAGMLFTDGYSNTGSPGAAEVTGLGAPFDPTPANSLAAIATKYYQATLRTGAGFPAGKVPVPSGCSEASPDPRLDCRADLHMNFYGVTLGARGSIYDSANPRDPYTAPYPAWQGHTDDNPRTVDDIWHATLNTRGEYINAKTPAAITEAMRRILASVGGGTTPSGTIALTGSRIGTGSLTVIPEYTSANNATDWYSTLIAQTVSSTPAAGVTYTTTWEASSQLPNSARSTIWLGKNQAAGVKPVVSQFTASSLTLAQLCSDPFATCAATGTRSIATKLGVTIDEAVAYLKGSQALEVSGATGKLRKRTTRLGDIVNSTPVVSAPTDDFGYQSLRSGTSTYDALGYKAYLASKKTRPTTVYVGANDGMLHAFDGASGTERFAYIPSTSWGHMGNLLFPYNIDDKNDQVFQHRYFVDGPVNVSDMHDGSAWKTVLVGTSGAGGKSVFAIDVTTPTSFSSSSVLWELNDSVATTLVKNNIGHVLGKPVIVPVMDGTTVKWKALFGNGYDSAAGRAALFVVDMATGDTKVITATESSSPTKNGLGSIVAIDRFRGTTANVGRDGYVDTVYGGDQNGAVWKFDLRPTTYVNQTVPFFAAVDNAGVRQPISGGFEAAAGPGGGVMLYFGTGSFSFVGDPDDKQVQSFYGVLDTFGGSVTRSQLQQQRVLVDTDGNRSLTTTGLSFGMKGWYLNLGVTTSAGVTTATGERAVGNPVVTSGVVFFPSFDPNTTDACATGGVNRLYGVNALSGGGALSQARVGTPDGALPLAGTGAIKLATTGSAPVKDVAVLTTPRGAPLAAGATAAEQLAAANQRCTMTVQAPGAPPLYLPRPCGRQSWRQVR